MPYQVPGLASIHKPGDVALRVPLKDLPGSRLARDEKHIADLGQ